MLACAPVYLRLQSYPQHSLIQNPLVHQGRGCAGIEIACQCKLQIRFRVALAGEKVVQSALVIRQAPLCIRWYCAG